MDANEAIHTLNVGREQSLYSVIQNIIVVYLVITRDKIVRGLEAHHVHYTYARDIRGSDNQLVKRGGFLERDSLESLKR